MAFLPVEAVEKDCDSNEVFDIYYFGNGEVGRFGVNSGVINPKTGLDTEEMVGYVEWSETNKTNYWSQDEELKNRVVQAVNTWTNAMTNRLDMDKHARKLRVGVFLDDNTWSGSIMGYAAGYARYVSVQTNFEKDSTYNSYSIVEWTLVHHYETDYYRKPGSAWVRYTNLLSSSPQNIDVALFLNPKELMWVGGEEVWIDRSKEVMQKVATHELGHSFGFDSDLYVLDKKAPYPAATALSGRMNRWDSLLTLDGKSIAGVRVKDGYTTIKEATSEFKSLQALHAAAWDPAMEPDSIQYDQERRLNLASGADKTGVHVSALCIMGNTLVHLSNPEDWVDGYSFDVMGAGGRNASIFSPNDLDAMRMLGYTLAVPESSPSGAADGEEAGLSLRSIVQKKEDERKDGSFSRKGKSGKHARKAASVLRKGR